jgi:hypothetical protein
LKIAEPLQEASATMAGLSDVSNDPQSAVDAWTALADMYTSFSQSVTNTDVKSAAEAVAEDTSQVRDAIQKVYVDNDMNALDEFSTASSEWQTSYTALTTLCTK